MGKEFKFGKNLLVDSSHVTYINGQRIFDQDSCEIKKEKKGNTKISLK